MVAAKTRTMPAQTTQQSSSTPPANSSRATTFVDEIVIDDDDAIIAELSDELKITTSTTGNFSGDRTVATEGLIIKTAASVTGASTVVLDADAGKYLQGIDLRAGTTGDSTIDASKDSVGWLPGRWPRPKHHQGW